MTLSPSWQKIDICFTLPLLVQHLQYHVSTYISVSQFVLKPASLLQGKINLAPLAQ